MDRRVKGPWVTKKGPKGPFCRIPAGDRPRGAGPVKVQFAGAAGVASAPGAGTEIGVVEPGAVVLAGVCAAAPVAGAAPAGSGVVGVDAAPVPVAAAPADALAAAPADATSGAASFR